MFNQIRKFHHVRFSRVASLPSLAHFLLLQLNQFSSSPPANARQPSSKDSNPKSFAALFLENKFDFSPKRAPHHSKDIYDLVNRGEKIGYQDSSVIRGYLNTKKVDSSKFRNYSSFDEYDKALSRGSKRGGVGAIVDELPSLRLFISMYCHKYTIIDSTYLTSGYGFAFQKGSPLAADISRGILTMKESGDMDMISRKWLADGDRCLPSNETDAASKSLNLDSFRGLFMIAGLSSSSALAIFLSIFLYKNRLILSSTASITQKLYDLARVFDGRSDDKPSPSSAESTTSSVDEGSSSDIRISCDEGRSSVDEGSSSVELQPIQDVLPPQEAT